MLTDFLFAEFEEGKPVEVLRVGTFVDRNGRTVEIAEEDLDVFVANFQAGAAGQEVPIDVNHEKGEAGGWIRSLTRDGEKLVAVPEWNELGRKLVGERIYRYLSATIDLAKKLIKSVSLVNFPAVKGLRPVELSEGLYSFQAAPGLVETLVAKVTQAVMDVLGKGETSPPEETEEAEFVIRKEDEEYCLYTSDGSRKLGCYPTREQAVDRERQIQYFKHRQAGEFEEAWAELQGNIESIVKAWTKWAGSFTKCVRALKGKPGIDNEEALCAWLHKQAEGKWPAEGSEYEPTAVELEALVAALSDVIQDSGGNTMTDEERAELEEKIRQDILAEMAEKEKTTAELKEQVRAEVEAEMAEKFAKREELREFAEEITSGDFGLADKPEEIVVLLAAIEDEEQLEKVKALLKSKVVDFSEHGSSRDGPGGKEKLPSAYAVLVRAWQEAGHDLAEFFEVNKDELGDMDQYDLSEFEKQE